MDIHTEVPASWIDRPARRAIETFVEQTISKGVPVEERVAVFDNDGTLWCEKPMPIQVDFILRRLFEMALADPELRQHPTLGRGYLECAYKPMVELLDYLEANGFSNYIASGGGRDFVRPVTQELYRIPRDRVVGTASTFECTSNDHRGTITHKAPSDHSSKPTSSGGRSSA
jgi:hypothetical protein